MIGYDAFRGCSNLSVVTLQSQQPPQVDVNAFASISQDAIAWVPAGTGAIYRAVDDGNTEDDKWYGLIVEDGSGTEKRIIMAQPVYKEVPWGTDGDHIGLPETVSVLLSDNSSIEVPVVWDTENYSGTLSEWLYGIPVNLPADIKNDLNIKARAYVTVSFPVMPEIKPAVFSMDLSAPEDINAEITWNDLRIIRNIKLLSRLDIPSVAFSVEGDRITIKKDDILSFNPKAGESFVLKVDIAFEDYLTMLIEFVDSNGGGSTTPGGGTNPGGGSGTPGGGSSGGTPSSGGSTPSGGGSAPSGGSSTSGGNPSAEGSASTVKAIISKETLNSSESRSKDYTINTSLASITLDSQAMSVIAGEAASDVTVTVTRVDADELSDEAKKVVGDRPVYDFKIASGDKVISQFGGNVTVTLPYTPEEGEDINAIVIYYINAEGKPEVVTNCAYDPATGTISFTTNHFSKYGIGYNKVCLEMCLHRHGIAKQ